MNADSPLSNIGEVISESEDDGIRQREQESMHRLNQYQTSASAGPEISGIPFPMYAATTPQIDYFAGFQGDIAPIPSIAERAKTRQRKTRTQHIADVLELTDEDEFIPRSPPSKTKKKAKSQQKKGTPPIAHPIEQRTPTVLTSNDLETTPVINARPKVRPKPIKKTQQQQLQSTMPQTSQATIPVPTSSFPPLQQKPPRNPIHFNLPPSDPPPPSSSTGDQDLHLPPIAFLPPAPIDSDVSLPSSQPGADIDQLGTPRQQDQLANNRDATLPLPPPTFFAGSSSLPPPNALTPPPPLPSIIDLSKIASTAAGPSTATNETDVIQKTKKPRKPRKKKGDTGNDQNNEPRATVKKGAKGKMNSVSVEVPLLPPHLENLRTPVVVAPKRKGKQKQSRDDEPFCEDELNIGPDSNCDFMGPTTGPSSDRNASSLPIGSRDSAGGDEELRAKPSASDKRKGRKRKELQESDDPRPTTVSPSKKKKTSNKMRNAEEDLSVTKEPSEGKQGDERRQDEETLSVTKEPPKKGKQGDERNEDEDVSQRPLSSRPGKGKGRMVITSDDEGDVQAHVESVPSPVPQKPNKRRKRDQPAEASESGKSNGKDISSHGDREVLQRVQPSDAQSYSPGFKIDTATQQRHDTPSGEKYPSLTSRYTIAPRTQTPAMSELIRRARSHPSSPFRGATESKSPIPGLAYSPYLKASRRTLSRIAPLHPNRRTPPPPLPPPPPKKKSKKELEMEEKWEEEIIEEIGGISEWLALSEGEKKDLKRMKRDKEMGYCED